MISILRSLWIWTACSSLVLLWLPLLLCIRLFDRDPLLRRTAMWLRRLGPLVAKVNPAWRVHLSGEERIDPTEVYVIVSNHQSLADIPLVAHLKIDAKWLAKAELFRFPVFGWMIRLSGHVSVERADRRKAAQSLLQCARYLRSGSSVLFFAEGTRSRDGELLPFNDGPFQLALREKCAVLPVVVEGTGSALPKATWLFAGTQDISLRVLEPMGAELVAQFDIATLREEVRNRIKNELLALRDNHR